MDSYIFNMTDSGSHWLVHIPNRTIGEIVFFYNESTRVSKKCFKSIFYWTWEKNKDINSFLSLNLNFYDFDTC